MNEESFDRAFRASVANMSQFKVLIPVAEDGSFDKDSQRLIADKYTGSVQKREDLKQFKKKLDEVFERYLLGAK